MALLTSARERRLWLWTLATVAAIYSTLGPARTVVDALRERDLLRLSFAVLVLLLVAGLVAHWVRRRPDRGEIGVALGVALAYLVAFLRIENPAERTHLIEYGIVAALIHQALLERARNGRHVPAPAALAVAATASLGLVDEGIQAVLPSRVFDWADVLFNALAGFMVIVARLALAPVRLPGWRLWLLWLIASGFGFGWSTDPGLFGDPRTFEVLPSVPAVALPQYRGIAVGGTLVGVLQWLALRRYVPGAVRWVAATLTAVLIGGVAAIALGAASADLSLIAGTVLYGTLAGSLQALLLRAHIGGGGWWVLASTLAWLVAIPAGSAFGPPGWAAYGAISGAALVGLVRRQVAPPPPA